MAQAPTLDHTTFKQEIDKFDQIKSEGMQHAEKRCRHLHMGNDSIFHRIK